MTWFCFWNLTQIWQKSLIRYKRQKNDLFSEFDDIQMPHKALAFLRVYTPRQGHSFRSKVLTYWLCSLLLNYTAARPPSRCEYEQCHFQPSSLRHCYPWQRPPQPGPTPACFRAWRGVREAPPAPPTECGPQHALPSCLRSGSASGGTAHITCRSVMVDRSHRQRLAYRAYPRTVPNKIGLMRRNLACWPIDMKYSFDTGHNVAVSSLFFITSANITLAWAIPP